MRSTVIFNILFGIVILSLSSCGDKPTDEAPETADNLVVSGVSATSFTVSITGSFTGISKVDLALGKCGVLYCEKSADYGTLFRMWKDGITSDGLMVFDHAKNSGELYSGVITGLYPDTEYCFCLFWQGHDGKRETSAVQTVRTQTFNPILSAVRMDSINYFDAVAKTSVKMDEEDAVCCEVGFLLSESVGCDINTSTIYPLNTTASGSYRKPFIELLPGRTYHVRQYVKYLSKSSIQPGYIYSEETSFSTRDFMETAVDLALPSGILWASCDLNESGPVNQRLKTSYYQWGAHSHTVFPEKNSNNPTVEWLKSHYEHWDAGSGTYTDIGADICGTEHDVVHLMLGGKWRMPSKADVEELIANCNVSKWVSSLSYLGIIEGTNGNVIKIGFGDARWCGTLDNEGKAYSFRYIPDNDNGRWMPNSGKIDFVMQERYNWLNIRPVWDPNMPD